MELSENGTPIEQARRWGKDYPHKRAVLGVCRALQQAHVPFGVITRKQLGELDRCKVLVLSNVQRMDAEEVEAVRE